MIVEITDEKLAKRLIVNGVANKVTIEEKPPKPDYKGRLFNVFINWEYRRSGIADHQDKYGNWCDKGNMLLTNEGNPNWRTFISPDGLWRSAKQKPGTVTNEIDSPLPLTTLEMAKKYGTEWKG